jgi:hypothetical protein
VILWFERRLKAQRKKSAISRFSSPSRRAVYSNYLSGRELWRKWGHSLQLMLRQRVTTEKGNILLYSGSVNFALRLSTELAEVMILVAQGVRVSCLAVPET